MQNANDAVIEFLLSQLRQQLTNNTANIMEEVKRWSVDRSIAGRGNYTDEENAIIDAYIGLEHNPYKQQCEDLAHEVLSLKNQLRDASALVAELREDNIKKSEHISHLTGQLKELHLALVMATGDVEAYKLIRKGGYISEGQRYVVGEHVPGATVNCRRTQTPVPPEQSGCRKEDTQECEHDWVLDEKGDYFVCAKCGKQEAELNDCRHANTVGLRKGFAPGFTKKCLDCGAKLK